MVAFAGYIGVNIPNERPLSLLKHYRVLIVSSMWRQEEFLFNLEFLFLKGRLWRLESENIEDEKSLQRFG